MSTAKVPYFIVNPNSGGKRGKKRWNELRKQLEARDVDFDVVFTESKGHAGILAADAFRHGARLIVAFGGDGTLNEVLNGLFSQKRENEQLTLGFVAAGSSNDFVRNLGGSRGNFLDRLESSKAFPVDVGKIECRKKGGVCIERYFLVNSTIGIVPEALRYFNQDTLARRIMKRVSVDLAVTASGLSALMKHDSTRYRLVINGEAEERHELVNLAVLKGSFFGGGMSYGFQASMDNGLFEVVGIEKIPGIEKLKTMLRFYGGTILDHPAVWRRSARMVTVEATEDALIEADGEIVGYLPAKYSVLPKAASVIF